MERTGGDDIAVSTEETHASGCGSEEKRRSKQIRPTVKPHKSFVFKGRKYTKMGIVPSAYSRLMALRTCAQREAP